MNGILSKLSYIHIDDDKDYYLITMMMLIPFCKYDDERHTFKNTHVIHKELDTWIIFTHF